MRRSIFAILVCLWVAPALSQDEPTPLNVFNGELPAGERTFYLAPDGDDDNPGSIDAPWALMHFAVQQLQPGDVLVLRGGVYDLPATVSLGQDGLPDQPIVVAAYPGEVPIFDFSSMTRARNNHGFRLNGDWWRLIGFTIRYAAHNGIRIDGSHNVLEQITAYENVDTGIHMAGGASHNLIYNCDSFRNFDPPEGGNADGFSAKFEVGPGNVFRGCRAWNNSDDGWDLWEAHSVVVIDSSWAFGNGDGDALGAGPEFDGNGNGFKLGGGPVPSTRPHIGHVVTRSMAFDNIGPSGSSKGFDYNNNFGGFYLAHNTAFNNGRNVVFPAVLVGQHAVFVNNVAFDPVGSTNVQLPVERFTAVGNSWQSDVEITSEMFASLNSELAKAPRNADGSLPATDLLKPVAGSFLVDAGVVSGYAYFGNAPDLGAAETVGASFTEAWNQAGSGEGITNVRVFDLPNAENWRLADDLAAGTDLYGDGTYTVDSDLWPGFEVVDALIPAIDSRVSNYLFRLADVAFDPRLELYVIHSDEIDPKPAWLADWTPVQESFSVTDSAGIVHSMSLYTPASPANGQALLGPNSPDGNADAPMYLVIAGAVFVANEDLPGYRPAAPIRVYPNPAVDRATVVFELDLPSDVTIRIYDTLGRQVAEPVRGFHAAGTHEVVWEVGTLPNGVYHVQMRAGGTAQTTSLVVVN